MACIFNIDLTLPEIVTFQKQYVNKVGSTLSAVNEKISLRKAGGEAWVIWLTGLYF